MYHDLSPDSVVSNFNKISTVSISDYHFWILVVGWSLMLVLSIVVVIQIIYQLHDNQEVSPMLAILTIGGLLIALVGYTGFFVF